MKHLLSVIVIIAISLFQNKAVAQEIIVMSYNIRYDTEDDGENSWDNRKEDVVKLISKNNPFVFGVQEALENQVEYIF